MGEITGTRLCALLRCCGVRVSHGVGQRVLLSPVVRPGHHHRYCNTPRCCQPASTVTLPAREATTDC